MSNARELAELGGSYGTGGFVGMKNRIINGAMAIHQRGGTISASGTGNTYGLDRFAMRTTTGSAAISMQQSTTAPAGFYNSLLCTVTTADASLAAGDINALHHKIEGVNIADLGWGTANAQPVTISFQVRSSVTGTYGVGVQNNAGDRSYPSTFTINAADTWEAKTLTIPGDTTGTWNIGTTSTAIYLWFSLGTGSAGCGTANAWAATDYRGTTGQVNWCATLSNTFYITGVQLEKGSTATSFDYRPYGTELALCQRYTYVIAGDSGYRVGQGWSYSTTAANISFNFPVSMRSAPTLVSSSALSVNDQISGFNLASVTLNASSNVFATLQLTGGSGMTARAPCACYFTSNSSSIILSSEL